MLFFLFAFLGRFILLNLLQLPCSLAYYTSYCHPSFACRASHLGLLYLGSLVVLFVYSVLYGLTAKESRWLGAITSAAVIILGKEFVIYIIF